MKGIYFPWKNVQLSIRYFINDGLRHKHKMKRKTWSQRLQKTKFSYNRYLQGLLCKLYWRTIHGSWWKPIERYSWTKTVKEPEQSTRKIASIFCSWRWKSGTRERRATLLFGPSTLKRKSNLLLFNLPTSPRCPPSRPRGRAREGRRTRQAPPSRGRGRCLRSSTFADHTPGK